MKVKCLAVVFLFLVTNLLSAQTLLWDREYYDFGFQAQHANDIVMDAANNVYVTGFVSEGPSPYDNVLAVVKYDKYGNEIWDCRYPGYGFGSEGISICLDNNGQYVYVAGYAAQKNNDIDLVVIKYSSSGQQIWDVTWEHNPGYCNYKIAFDFVEGQRIVYVATMHGNYACLVQIFDDGIPDIFMLDYVWENNYDWRTKWLDIVIDKNSEYHDIYVTGFRWNGVTARGTVAKYRYWMQLAWDDTPETSHRCYAMDIDNTGNIYITGQWQAEYSHPVIWKYDSDGTPQWSPPYYHNTGNPSLPRDIRVFSATGDCYITAREWNTLFGVWSNVVIAVNKFGNELWDSYYVGSTTRTCFELDITSNCVYACGGLKDDFGKWDFLTLCYKRDNGTLLWDELYSPLPYSYAGAAIDVHPDPFSRNKVYIGCTGYKSYTSYAYHWLTLMYSYYEPTSSPSDAIGHLDTKNLHLNSLQNTLNIKFTSLKQCRVEIRIYDETGRLVDNVFSGNAKNGLNQITYNVGNLPSGIYFLRCELGDEVFTEKVVIRR